MTTATPGYLEVLVDTIPVELRRLGWVLWRRHPIRRSRRNREGSLPITDPTQKASSTNPSTWGKFGDAVDAYALLTGRHRDPDPTLGPLVGIGVVLTAEANITCIDLDRVLDGERWTLEPRASSARLVVDGDLAVRHGAAPLRPRHPARGAQGRPVRGICCWPLHCDHRPPLARAPDHLADRQGHLDQLLALAQQKVPVRRPYSGPSVTPPDDLGGALLAKVQPGARRARPAEALAGRLSD